MASTPASVVFDTAVAAQGNNTGLVVPGEVIEQLAAGNRPPVLVSVDNINAAKSPETRQRRIDKAITLFVDGKQR
jgi:antitoxin component of MazEF toxin-antitoxin module